MNEPLLTVEEIKLAQGKAPTPHPVDDAKYTAAINAASALVRAYTGLKFEVSSGSISTDRQFEYDGSGYLDIDEVRTITAIKAQAGFQGAVQQTYSQYEWGAYPLNMPVKLWLRLPQSTFGLGISPEMGFTWNLDTIGYRDYGVRPTIVTVTGVWGWSEIPADVKQAVLWTALAMTESQKPYTQESIENYSRTRGADVTNEAIPERAQIALLPYVIPQV